MSNSISRFLLLASLLCLNAQPVFAQLFDLPAIRMPKPQFKQIIPNTRQSSATVPKYNFEEHPTLYVVFDHRKSTHFACRIRSIVAGMHLKPSELRLTLRDKSSLAGSLKLRHDGLKSKTITAPLPVMNITTGENSALSGNHTDAEIQQWISKRLGLD